MSDRRIETPALAMLMAGAVWLLTPPVSGAGAVTHGVVFYENFESHGANSSRQPSEWVSPTWNMPRSPDGKWWIIGTNYYGSASNPKVARQCIVGNISCGRRRWATTRDFRIVPDPVRQEFILELKVLQYGYLRGALNVRLTDGEGNGYGCRVAMAGESSRKHKWTNAIVRWDGGRDRILATTEGPAARIPVKQDGGIVVVRLRLTRDGALSLEIDDTPVARTSDKAYTTFIELGVSVEYETRFVIDDIKLSTLIDLEE